MEANSDGERILAMEIAGRLGKGINLMGGQLILTNRRLIFVPLISESGLKLGSGAAKIGQNLHDWDFSPHRLLYKAIGPLTKPLFIPLDKITSLTGVRRQARPAIRITWTDTTKLRTMDFAIFAKWFSLTLKENYIHRDQFLTAVLKNLPS